MRWAQHPVGRKSRRAVGVVIYMAITRWILIDLAVSQLQELGFQVLSRAVGVAAP
jgi:hypothetical protein